MTSEFICFDGFVPAYNFNSSNQSEGVEVRESLNVEASLITFRKPYKNN